MQEIGTVISAPFPPNSNEFWFVLNDNKGIPVRKGQFVQLQSEQGLLVARVAEITKTNKYFERADSVSEFEKSGKPLHEQFPVERWEYLTAHANLIGIYENGIHKRASFPPSPGTKVSKVDEGILFGFLGLDKERGLNIGKIEFHGLDAKLNLTKLFQKHCAILAQTGFGKSFLTSVLIEELLDRSLVHGRPAVIVVDPHGEYTGFSDDENYVSKTKVFNEKSISIAARNLSERQICEFQPRITDVARRELGKIIKSLKDSRKVYDMRELIEGVEASNIPDRTKYPLVSWLSDLDDTGLFGINDSPNVDELASEGQLSILDLSEFIQSRQKQMIVTYFAKKLFAARRSNRIHPFILIVEEAHQFAPEQEERSSAISKNIIETIAREGRKFLASLVLISQRPVQLSTTALSQCNSNIILRVSNPYDLKHIGESCEGVTKDILDSLPGLKVGEALITGEVVRYPLLVNVRERKSAKSKGHISFEDALVNFQNKKLSDKRDIETFI